MFCGKCGFKNADGAEFCTNCGAKLRKPIQTKPSFPLETGQNAGHRKAGRIAVAAVIVLAAALCFYLFGGRSDRATIERYLNAQFNADARSVIDLMPPKIMDYALEQEGYTSDEFDDLMDDMDEELQDQLDYLDSYLGEGWDFSYEIVEIEDIKGDDLDDIKDAYDVADIKVSAAESAEVEITVTSHETESSNTLYIDLVKVGRSWYLDLMSMGNLF